ncbi:type III pantothenate kinase [Pedobacter sp. SD-b]|uniref:Type III pantothenate kinase n=1 Tax=Pedobacter segetis TaxID=2793069 RepID=A0ABS1BH55_9SPHI|nr:type III pantothenate kinase [Pedobacter segetis]MBK0382185.1 type III pantothenate kinase [Pedobacter segetis]
MANLVIDVGNSANKIAVFDNDVIIHQVTSLLPLQKDIENLKALFPIKSLIISSVKNDSDLIDEDLTTDFNYIKFNNGTKIPINNQYKSPKSLGLDRLAAVIGAKSIYPNQNVLTIDAGTCITYDFIDEKANYYGGSISPGINMRLKAMNHFTAKLPLVHFEPTFDKEFGDDSNSSMLSGVINGLLYEVEGFIKNHLKKYPTLKIILCGGDATFFDTRFKNSIFAHLILHEPFLVLKGLNTVVKYQHDHN